jgi:predicted HicB family RNase H-like nuclease
MSEQKGRYTEAQKKSAEKYLQEKVEDIRIRVPKGQKAAIKAYAEAQGKSLNQSVVDAIAGAMK